MTVGCDAAGTGASSGLAALSAELVPRLLVVEVVDVGVSGSRYGAFAYTVVPASNYCEFINQGSGHLPHTVALLTSDYSDIQTGI